MKNLRLIVLGGPTASGKTAAAIQLANHYNGVIISADSRQLYYELNIGVAKPTEDELSQATHYFINHTSIHNPYSAGMYAKEVRALLDSLFSQFNTIILSGGTGFYIKAVLEGLDDLPSDIDLRTDLKEKLRLNGLEFLQQYFTSIDKKTENIDLQNPQRLIRYIELVILYKKPLVEIFQSNQSATPLPYPFQCFYLNPERTILFEKINNRVDLMMQNGLLEEVKSLYPWRHLSTLQTVGYTELFDHLEEKTTLNEAIELIKRNTRRYAKRQLTWFKNQGAFSPIENWESVLFQEL